MYKKITHNIVEEHFDHPAVVPKSMFRSGEMTPKNKSVDQFMATQEEDKKAIKAFKHAVEKLWKEHNEYTRAVMISTLAGLEDVDAATAKLMKVQEALGAAIIPYYGNDACTQLTSLLTGHVNVAIDLVKAIKESRNTTLLENACAANSEALATFLDTADTDNWPKATVLAVLTELSANAIKQTKARYARDWAADIEANDASCEIIYTLAKTFSSGIINKFPEKFVVYFQSSTVKKK